VILERLRIALVSPPMLPVPPVKYAGTERIVAVLADELHRRGHKVTLFAPGDSDVPCELIPTIPHSLWSLGYRGDVSSYINVALSMALADQGRFDVIHSHVETLGLLAARLAETPIVSTFHGRLDGFGAPELLDALPDVPLVAISASQRRWSPAANWVATIHHGLPLAAAPFRTEPGNYLAFVGRVAEEKGVAEAIELARDLGLNLRMAAKVYDATERELFERAVQPAIDEGVVDFVGEVGAADRDAILAGALATVMLGSWPEPFGLVAIESMATGTPVVARRAGALPEIVRHGIDGFIVDDLAEANLAVRRARDIDRRAVRSSALQRFSVERMVDQYEDVYRSLIASAPRGLPARSRGVPERSAQGGSPSGVGNRTSVPVLSLTAER